MNVLFYMRHDASAGLLLEKYVSILRHRTPISNRAAPRRSLAICFFTKPLIATIQRLARKKSSSRMSSGRQRGDVSGPSPSWQRSSKLEGRQEEKFVNHGLRRWEEGRARWLQLSDKNRQRRYTRPIVDDDVIYDTIFSKPMGWLLPHPVPLAHMVELLEDEWSDE